MSRPSSPSVSGASPLSRRHDTPTDSLSARPQRRALRRRYRALIASLCAPEERERDSSRASWARYAEWLAVNPNYPLNAALTLYHAGNPLTAAEIAALLVGHERGSIGPEILESLASQPERLPAPSCAAAIRRHLRRD